MMTNEELDAIERRVRPYPQPERWVIYGEDIKALVAEVRRLRAELASAMTNRSPNDAFNSQQFDGMANQLADPRRYRA